MAVHDDFDIGSATPVATPIQFRRNFEITPRRRPLPAFEGPIAAAIVRLRLEHTSLRVDFLPNRPAGEPCTDGKFILKSGPLGIEPWVEVYGDSPEIIQLFTLVHEIAHYRDFKTVGTACFFARTVQEAEVAAYHIGREMIASRPYLSRYISPAAWRRFHETCLDGTDWTGTLDGYRDYVLGETEH